MINFRYHVISLVAVFLALGIGIVMGSTVIDRAIVDGLRNRIDTAEHNSITRKTENDRLNDSISNIKKQDTILAGRTVKDTLTDQTVYVITLGSVPDTNRIEVMELLGVAGARLGGTVDLNENFIGSDTKKCMTQLKDIAGVKEFLGTQNNRNAEYAAVLFDYFSRQANAPSSSTYSVEEMTMALKNCGIFSEREQPSSYDPVQNVSFIVLMNRSDLANKTLSSFATNFVTSLPETVGLIGNETDKPSRVTTISSFGAAISSLSIVDNVEDPSGRASLVIAHGQTITGSRNIYGVSSKATSPAPALTSP